MAVERDWIDEVRRWCKTEAQGRNNALAGEAEDRLDVGYEAAHPVLQSRHWPDSVPDGPGETD